MDNIVAAIAGGLIGVVGTLAATVLAWRREDAHTWRRDLRSAYAAFLSALDDFWAHFPAIDIYEDWEGLPDKVYLDDRGVQLAFEEVWLIAPRDEALRKAAVHSAKVAAQMRQGFQVGPTIMLAPWPAPAIEFEEARHEFARQARKSLGLPELPASGYGVFEGLAYGDPVR